jgi:hypothetical protein
MDSLKSADETKQFDFAQCRFWQRPLMSWQGIADCQQACLAVIEDQTIRGCHFGARCVAAEVHGSKGLLTDQ